MPYDVVLQNATNEVWFPYRQNPVDGSPLPAPHVAGRRNGGRMNRVPSHMTLLRRARHTRIAVALAAGALALAACGGSGGSDDVPVAAPEDASAPVPPPGADEAPDTTVDDADAAAVFASVFAATTPIDAEFDAASLAGHDTVLWFWAPWCTICRAEAPDINDTVARFGDDVLIVGVAGRGGIDEMRGFIDDTATTGLTHVADLDGGVWNAFGIFAQPAFAFIDDTGEIEVFVGGLRADDLADRIDALLAT
jgi:thiol-disulfide isomerase/thioredoxin